MRRIIVGLLAAAGLIAAAHAIQPGTTGTEKRFQQQGLRSGVLLQPNLTATATAGADSTTSTATLNQAGSGVITTPSIATPAASDHAMTLTNDMIAAADIVLCSVQKGTATAGSFYCGEVTTAAGSAVFRIMNRTGGVTADGTYKISFFVIKQNANGSD